MILSQADFRSAVDEGQIEFDPPLEEGQWGEASVDLRLGYQFTTLKQQKGLTISVADGLEPVALSNLWNTDDLRERDKLGRTRSHEIRPGEFVLAQTYEKIKVPRNMIARVERRSTYARVGLSMHQTAPWIQPGWSGRIILELMNNGPLTIKLTPTMDRPCQLTFFKLTSEVPVEHAYGAKAQDTYQDQKHPLEHKGRWLLGVMGFRGRSQAMTKKSSVSEPDQAEKNQSGSETSLSHKHRTPGQDPLALFQMTDEERLERIAALRRESQWFDRLWSVLHHPCTYRLQRS